MSIAPAFVGQGWMLHGMPDGSIGAAHEDRYTKYYPGVPGKLERFIGIPSANVLDNGWYVNIHCQTHLPKGYSLPVYSLKHRRQRQSLAADVERIG